MRILLLASTKPRVRCKNKLTLIKMRMVFIGSDQQKERQIKEEETPLHDYKIFHLLASDIDSDGFDKVVRINPQEEIIALD